MQGIVDAGQHMAVPVLIGLLGFWLFRKRILPESGLTSLIILALDVALPCQILGQLLTAFDPGTTPDWWHQPLWWIGFTVWTGALTFPGIFLFPRAVRHEAAACLFYPNAIFVPLILFTGLYGAEHVLVTELFLFTLLFPAFRFSTAPRFFPAGSGSVRVRLLTPVFLATLAGIILRLAGVHRFVPMAVTDGLRLLGTTATPILLIYLGGTVHLDARVPGPGDWADGLRFIVLKNLLFPLATLGLLHWIDVPTHMKIILLVQSAVPPVTALPAIAERSGGSRARVSRFLVASFVASIVTLPFWLSFLPSS